MSFSHNNIISNCYFLNLFVKMKQILNIIIKLKIKIIQKEIRWQLQLKWLVI
jgi:hypothetical protein